ncbi:hypothetical protein [Candidatus Thioglobus sp.]|jgi:hypothetical protein|uniref:hypothetical protein n=1 Tax=Candidatus Thioglobus sp. TaxID=2026721 RepID=UPI0032429F72
MKKQIIIATALLTTGSAFAEDDALERHNESCVSCHVIEHDDDFYNRKNTRMKTHFDLRRQVSTCVVAFSVGWFPDEEAGEVKLLNDKYYKLKE